MTSEEIVSTLTEMWYRKHTERPYWDKPFTILMHPEIYYKIQDYLFLNSHIEEIENLKFRGCQIYRSLDLNKDEIKILC